MGRFANSNPDRRGGFSNFNKRVWFPYPNHDKTGGCPNSNEYRMKVEIPSFSGNHDIESFLDWIYEVDKLFDMTYVPIGESSQICNV